MKRISELLQDSGENWTEKYVVSNAPSLIAFFANFVVLVAEVRVYDVMYAMTNSWWKALSASFACAVPFVLWEVAWQYNHTTDMWRKISLGMAGVAFVTSIVLGVADFLQFYGDWSNFLLGSVVVLTGFHTVVGFLYYYNDPDVARRRRKAQALAAMEDHEINAMVAESLLQRGVSLMEKNKNLERQYDPEDVEAILGILRGERHKNAPKSRQNGSNFNAAQKPAVQYQKSVKTAEMAEIEENPTRGRS